MGLCLIHSGRCWTRFALVVFVLLALSGSSHACSIFVLTDPSRALFCNNEDYLNASYPTRLFDMARAMRHDDGDLLDYGSKTRIWFVPASQGNYGCAYVGYGDGAGQGGLNTQGLSYDWVATGHQPWTPDKPLLKPNGIPSMRMLETCATVDEAIAFFHRYRDDSFHESTILVADKSGASVVIGAKGGELLFEQSTHTRGIGAGGERLQEMLAKSPPPVVASGSQILRACAQKDICVTLYSNIFDLKSGDIFLYPFSGRDDVFTLNLTTELGKGGHYYDMTALREQLVQGPRPLLANMRRDRFQAEVPLPTSYWTKKLLFVTYLVSNSAVLFALIWIPRLMLGHLKGVVHLALRGVPLVSALSADALNVVLVRIANDYFFAEQHLGGLTVWSVAFYLSFTAFVSTAFYGVLLVIRVPRSEVNPCVWWHSVAVAAANLIYAVYLVYWVCAAL